MASNLPKADPSTLLNSRDRRLDGIDRRCAKASIAINRQDASAATELGGGVVSLVFETFAAIGLSDKEAAYTMALDPAQLSRIKSGQARLPFDALWRLPDLFWLEFRKRVDSARGLDAAREADVFAEHVGQLVTFVLKHQARKVSA